MSHAITIMLFFITKSRFFLVKFPKYRYFCVKIRL